MKFYLVLALLTTTTAFGQRLTCSKQKALSQLKDQVLFGFDLNELPLGTKLPKDYSVNVVKGSCVFEVFYMFTYDRTNRADGWYFPLRVSVDTMADTIYDENLAEPEAQKLQLIADGMQLMREKLSLCECSTP